MPDNPVVKKARRQRRIDAGFCYKCGSRPPETRPDSKCQQCRLADRGYSAQYEQRKAHTCRRCHRYSPDGFGRDASGRLNRTCQTCRAKERGKTVPAKRVLAPLIDAPRAPEPPPKPPCPRCGGKHALARCNRTRHAPGVPPPPAFAPVSAYKHDNAMQQSEGN